MKGVKILVMILVGLFIAEATIAGAWIPPIWHTPPTPITPPIWHTPLPIIKPRHHIITPPIHVLPKEGIYLLSGVNGTIYPNAVYVVYPQPIFRAVILGQEFISAGPIAPFNGVAEVIGLSMYSYKLLQEMSNVTILLFTNTGWHVVTLHIYHTYEMMQPYEFLVPLHPIIFPLNATVKIEME